MSRSAQDDGRRQDQSQAAVVIASSGGLEDSCGVVLQGTRPSWLGERCSY